MTKTVYIVGGGNHEYRSMFERFGFTVASRLSASVNLMCFTGGADVSPSLYCDKAHHTTSTNRQRDEEEIDDYIYGQANQIPMVGICRGGQFLNVMNGGRMYQNVTNHTAPHDLISTETGETIFVSSTHHQMMMPTEYAVILGVANKLGSREWYDGEIARRDQSNTDYEVVFYPDTKSLCFQPHPEFSGNPAYARMTSWFFELINDKLGV